MNLSFAALILGLGQLVVVGVIAAEHTLESHQLLHPQCWKGSRFPARAAWLPFERLWEIHHKSMLFAGDSSTELRAVKAAISKYSARSGVPAELIFAIMMRESSGRVDTICGDDGRSCGLMQVQGPQNYVVCKKHPCRADVIDRMIKCGTVGACPGQTGSNLSSCLSTYQGLYGAAARCYNTGSVTDTNDYTVARYGIRPYVQDIANILLGAQSRELARLDRQCFP